MKQRREDDAIIHAAQHGHNFARGRGRARPPRRGRGGLARGALGAAPGGGLGSLSEGYYTRASLPSPRRSHAPCSFAVVQD